MSIRKQSEVLFILTGDSLSYHAGQKFSTYDVDNDEWKEGSCASEHEGAWWYKECDKRYNIHHLIEIYLKQ